MSHKLYLYPKWLRLWHLLNALMFIVLIATGISMQYTDKETTALILPFDWSVRWHNIAAIVLVINYMIYVIGNRTTKNNKHYKLEKKGLLNDLMIQFKYYASGMFKGEKHPFPVTEKRKFNPLQKVTYVLAMYVAVPLLIISGIGLLFPEITIKMFLGVSGLILTDVLHITMGFFLSVFMILHIYTCTLGAKPTSLFWGMISGYHRDDH